MPPAIAKQQKKIKAPPAELVPTPEPRRLKPTVDIDLSSVSTFLKMIGNEEASNAIYTPADLREGFLLLTRFSRPVKEPRKTKEEKLKAKPVSKIQANFDQFSWKIVNNAYAKLVGRFPHNPFGFFCEASELDDLQKVLRHTQECAAFLNYYAKEQKLNREVSVDVFPIKWDVTADQWRLGIGKMIAQKLIDLREVYTTTKMNLYRIRMDRVRHMERLVVGKQSDLVEAALTSTQQQRKIMVAIYGDKKPPEWLDIRTHQLKPHIKLDFTPIDNAIKEFCPSWEPPGGLPF